MDRNKKIHWEVGRAFQKREEFLKVLNRNPDISYGSINVYDGISQCRWNGGRFVTKENMKYDDLEMLYGNNINISIPFTNPDIDLSDVVGNETLERFHRKGNRIILRNEELRKYIKNNYPNYELSYSITASYAEEILWNLKGEAFWDFYKKKMDEYDIVVVPKELLEPPHLSKIHCLDISRIEFVVDNDCYLYCKFMGQMYRYLGQLNKVEPYGKVYDLIYDKTCLSDCHLGDENFTYWYSHQKLQELIDMGFVRFKIARHEEYPIERLVEQWEGYFVDYNKPDVDPDKWKKFWERGKNLPLNSKRNIINE